MPVAPSAEAFEPVAASHGPGVTLRELLQRADLSPERFARRLVRLAAEHGIDRRLDSKTPYKWLRGAIPRYPWPALAAHELSTRLGIQITASDLGWPDASMALLPADAGLDQPWTSDGALNVLAKVTGQQASPDRLFLPLCDSALTTLTLDWLTAEPSAGPARAGGRPVGADLAQDVEHITERLQQMDARHGSGLVLPLVQDHARNLTSILAEHSYPADAGTRLHAAAASLHHLAGRLCHDAGRIALAQRHQIAALRSAHAAGDRSVAVAVLASMSAQAGAAGQPAPALYLARAAKRGHPNPSPRLAAAISFAAAKAHAAAGDGPACRAALYAARQALAVDGPGTPEIPATAWLDRPAGHLEAGSACLLLGDYQQAVTCFRAALRDLDPVTRARDTAFAHAGLALAWAGQRHPERACEQATRAITILASTVDSTRCTNSLRQLCDVLRPYRRRPAVTAFASQVDTLLSRR